MAGSLNESAAHDHLRRRASRCCELHVGTGTCCPGVSTRHRESCVRQDLSQEAGANHLVGPEEASEYLSKDLT
jgi:hypothetical protein